MSKIRVATLAAIALAAANLTGVAVASAATHSPNAAASNKRPTPAALLASGKDSVLHSVAAAALTEAASATPAAAPRPVAHLDPQTDTLPTTKGGLVHVVVSGSGAPAAVQRVGGRVLTSSGGASSVEVPKGKLAALAQSTGVSNVTAPETPVDEDTSFGPSQAGGASGAASWNVAGFSGTGVKLAIVDAGFGSSDQEFQAEQAAGHLGPNTQLINVDCTDNGAPDTAIDPHGLETAELAQQMAPNAQLFLYCIGSSVGFNSAATAIINAGIKLASSSLGFPGDSRGDGTGASGSAASAVERARKAGVLWIESAGNQANDHWGQTMTDTDHDGILDLGGPLNKAHDKFEDDAIFVPGGDVQAGASDGATAEVDMQWDQWPSTGSGVTLTMYGFQCQDAQCQNFDQIPGNGLDGSTISVTHVVGAAPELSLDTSGYPNFGEFDQVWDVVVRVGPSAVTNERVDLNYFGEFDGPSILDCPTVNQSNNECNVPAAASAQSMSAPADSPYAMAVGAVDVGADGSGQHLETFSSRGPTIDGRIKPDITGWDGLSSYLPEYGQGFYGTSAAAPVVAGAAAIVLGSNPNMDASQIEAFLEQQANHGVPANPPLNTYGHGPLTLGPATAAQTPAGTEYTAIAPVRVFDTRPGNAFPPTVKAPIGPATGVTVDVSGVVPADATSVVINLTGTGATIPTFLAAYPGGAAFPGTSNVNLSKTDSTAAVLAPVTLSPTKTITVYNSANHANAVVDVVGYFTPVADGGLYTAVASHRVLDTRGPNGGHDSKVQAGHPFEVTPNAPAGATAVAINLTGTNGTTGTFFNVSPDCSVSSSALNFTNHTRANMAIVKLDSNGQFCVSSGGAQADAIVDVLGFFGTTGDSYFPLPTPTRVLDSRIGNGGQTTGHPVPIGPGAHQVIYAAGVGEIPVAADGLFTDVVEANTSIGGYLTAYNGSAAIPTTSTVNFSVGRVVSNAAIVPTLAHQFGIYNPEGNTNAAVDVFGYFLNETA